jgi:toxin FitB
MLLDSNIIIYAAKPEHQALRDWLSQQPISVSALSQVEVLGYHRLSQAEQQLFTELFASFTVLPIDILVIDLAILLRQQRRLGLGDSIIAATALIQDLPLATHNIDDFRWIDTLRLVDPL